MELNIYAAGETIEVFCSRSLRERLIYLFFVYQPFLTVGDLALLFSRAASPGGRRRDGEEQEAASNLAKIARELLSISILSVMSCYILFIFASIELIGHYPTYACVSRSVLLLYRRCYLVFLTLYRFPRPPPPSAINGQLFIVAGPPPAGRGRLAPQADNEPLSIYPRYPGRRRGGTRIVRVAQLGRDPSESLRRGAVRAAGRREAEITAEDEGRTGREEEGGGRAAEGTVAARISSENRGTSRRPRGRSTTRQEDGQSATRDI